MAESGGKRRRLRMPRKAVFVVGAIFLLATGSGAAAYLLGGAKLLHRASPVYGLDCTLVDKVGLIQGDGEHWVREYITVSDSDPQSRVRTGMRAAIDAASKQNADLVLVVVGDARGPSSRALMRDDAVGARIVYAPHPERVRALSDSYRVRYVDARPNAAGRFFGNSVEMPTAAAQALAAAMTKPYGCKDPAAEAAAKEAAAHAEGGKKPAHGEAKPHAAE